MKLLVFGILAYGGIVAMLYFAQTWMLFPGAHLPSRPIDGPLTPERLEVATADGAKLHGLLFRAENERADLLLGFGGNAQDAELLGHDLAADFGEMHVAVFHYRGYGPSTGSPSERALLGDALVIHDRLVEHLRPAKTYAIGISLGSAVATWLSKERDIAGLVLITPFDSVEAVAKETYFWVPVGLLLQHRFPSVEFMAGNRTPTAVIAAEQDRIVRPHRTQALAEQIPNLVFNITLPDADHNTIGHLPTYRETVRAAMAAVREAAEEKTVSGL